MTTAKQYAASIAGDRNAWAERAFMCFACRRYEREGVFGFQTHEIIKKSQLINAWWHRCNALTLHGECHAMIHSRHDYDHALQLAMKLKFDPIFFNLREFNKMRLESQGKDSQKPITIKQVRDQSDWMENNPEWWR